MVGWTLRLAPIEPFNQLKLLAPAADKVAVSPTQTVGEEEVTINEGSGNTLSCISELDRQPLIPVPLTE
jgi:hypothetical protein